MRISQTSSWLLSLLVVQSTLGAASQDQSTTVDPFHLRPFRVNLSGRASRMLNLVKNTQLPEFQIPGANSAFGITLDVIKSLRKYWISGFDWPAEQRAINRYHQYTAVIEGLTIHFIHEKSTDPNAIPIILQHGWPGSFLEFLPVVNELTKKVTTATGKPVSFNVVVPSLPGFGFSSPVPLDWHVNDTARVFDTLMTQVLGYETYAAHGTDWGSVTAYKGYANFNETVRALHLNFMPFYGLSPDQMAAENFTLTPDEAFSANKNLEYVSTGNGYLITQTTKPNTIGLTLNDNPVGILAWIGEKLLDWSDPRWGTGPSVMSHREVLRHASLYHLTGTALSSVYIYASNPDAFPPEYTKALTDAPLLFSAFKHNIAFWPKELVARVGNLVRYKYHEFGGHFPALDNPPALIADLREIAEFWKVEY